MATIANKAVKISQKHLLGIQDLSISDVKYILSEAKQFIQLNRSKNKKIDIFFINQIKFQLLISSTKKMMRIYVYVNKKSR